MSKVTVKSLRAEIESVVQDESFDGFYLGWMNECVNDLTEEADLNDLFSFTTVTTNESVEYVSLPDDFHKSLKRVRSSNQSRDLEIVPFDDLLDRYSSLNNEGDIIRISVVGSRLYYQPIPSSSDTLTLFYYRQPIQMAAETDTPDGIPCFYKSPVIVPYVCWRAFEKMEDGFEGQKVNSAYFKRKFEENKSKLFSRNAMHNTLKRKSFRA